MEADIKWLIGILVGVIVTFSGTLIATFRNMSAKWSASVATLHKKIDDADRDINKSIADVKEKYVRQDHLNEKMDWLEKAIKEVRDEQREQTRQVLSAIASVAQNNSERKP